MKAHSSHKSTTNVTIFKQLPHGYLVKTKDNQFGLIRARELSWENRKNWRKLYQIGDTVTVLPLKMTNESTEFSARLVHRDPWDSVDSKYSLGMLVTAVVTHVSEHTVWTEIEPGMDGILSKRDLPDWFKKEIDLQDCFWPDDRVNLVITKIDRPKRQFALSLKEARKLQDSEQSYLTNTSNASDFVERRRETAVDLSDIPTKIIWIVEDDEAQRNSISRWLVRQNYKVRSFESAEACLEELKMSKCDIILTDVGLAGISGFELIEQISAAYPHIVCALMTDLFRINQSEGILFAIDQGNAVLCKPIMPDDIADFLVRLHEGTHKTKQNRRNKLAISSQMALNKKTDQKEKKKVLYTLMRKTYAEKAILFLFNPLIKKVSVVSAVGHLKTWGSAISHLIHSPVRDVAEDDKLVSIQNTDKREEYLQHLTSYIEFGSCIGIPIPIESNERFALFLFHSQPKFFIHVHEDYAESAAFRLAALIEKEKMLDQMEAMQKLAMMGNLSRAMVHEINHRLGPVGFAIEELEESCIHLQNAVETKASDLAQAVENTISYINELTTGMEGLVKTAKLFGDLTTQSEVQLTDLEKVISEVVWIMADLAKDYKTAVHWQPGDHLRLTRINPSHLKQVLLNIMTNSLQHIDAMRDYKKAFKGHIFVSLIEARTAHSIQYQILVRDNGPGVHQNIHKKIFENGYTLGKPDGNGLGLFISKNLIDSVNGLIFVKDSIRYWGTTMGIQLPIVLS